MITNYTNAKSTILNTPAFSFSVPSKNELYMQKAMQMRKTIAASFLKDFLYAQILPNSIRWLKTVSSTFQDVDSDGSL